MDDADIEERDRRGLGKRVSRYARDFKDLSYQGKRGFGSSSAYCKVGPAEALHHGTSLLPRMRVHL